MCAQDAHAFCIDPDDEYADVYGHSDGFTHWCGGPKAAGQSPGLEYIEYIEYLKQLLSLPHTKKEGTLPMIMHPPHS